MNIDRKRVENKDRTRYFVQKSNERERRIRSFARPDGSAAGNGKRENADCWKMIYGKVRKICLTDLVPMPIIVKVRQSSSVGRATHS